MAQALKVGDTVVCVDLKGTHGIPHTPDSQALHLNCRYTVTKVYELHDGRIYGVFLNNYHGGWWLADMFELYVPPEPTAQELVEKWKEANLTQAQGLKDIEDAQVALDAMGFELTYRDNGYVWTRWAEEVLK